MATQNATRSGPCGCWSDRTILASLTGIVKNLTTIIEKRRKVKKDRPIMRVPIRKVMTANVRCSMTRPCEITCQGVPGPEKGANKSILMYHFREATYSVGPQELFALPPVEQGIVISLRNSGNDGHGCRTEPGHDGNNIQKTIENHDGLHATWKL